MLRQARRTDLSRNAGRPDGVTYRQQYVRCGNHGCRRCPPTGPGHGPYWYGFIGTTANALRGSTSASSCHAASRYSPIQTFRLTPTTLRANHSMSNRRIPNEPGSLTSSPPRIHSHDTMPSPSIQPTESSLMRKPLPLARESGWRWRRCRCVWHAAESRGRRPHLDRAADGVA